MSEHAYNTTASQERLLTLNTCADRLAGYARLSLPSTVVELGIDEIRDSALLRELHVYGQALEIGIDGAGSRVAQHLGLGTRLLEKAERIAAGVGFGNMAVIASVGTREYYRSRGYGRTGNYMVKAIT